MVNNPLTDESEYTNDLIIIKDYRVRSDMADYVSHNNNFTDGGGAIGNFPDL